MAARVVAVVEAATPFSRAVGVDTAALLAEVVTRLEDEVRGGVGRRVTEAQATIVAVIELIGGELERKAPLTTRQTRVRTQIESGLLSSKLADVWDQTGDPGPLEAYVETLVARGLDGERLVWAVIGFEAQRHVRLIHHEANKLANHFPDQTTDDMVSYGWLGLRLALRRFDPDRGLQFATYACKRISGAIRDGMRSESHLAKRLITQVRRVSQHEEELAAKLGRIPTRAEVAETVGMSVSELAASARFGLPVSLDEMRSNLGSRGAEPDVLNDADSTIAALEDVLLADAVTDAFQQLPEDVAEVAYMVLYQGLAVAEVERVTGVPARHVRQRCRDAREHLAEHLAAWA